MRTRRRATLAVLLVVTTFAVSSGAGAQQAGDVVTASGSVSVAGSYTASGTSGTGATLPPSGTYQASVAFTASATLTSFDILTQTGTFSSSGAYTAQVSAPDVPTFDGSGSFAVTGSFTASGYTLSGSATIAAPDSGSVTFNGGGAYDLGASSVTANGSYNGSVQTVAFGAATVSGDYSGAGSVAVNPSAITMQIALPTNLLGGIGTAAAAGPIAAMALATRAPAATPPALGSGTGTFATPPSPLPTSGVSLLQWNGGTVDALAMATRSLEGVSITVFVGGQAVALIPGAPAFVNTAFVALYPGEVPAGTLLALVR